MGGIAAVKALEELLVAALFNAALDQILRLQRNAAPGCAEAQLDRLAVHAVFDGVVSEDADELADGVLIAAEGQPALDVRRDWLALLLGHGKKRLEALRDGVAH